MEQRSNFPFEYRSSGLGETKNAENFPDSYTTTLLSLKKSTELKSSDKQNGSTFFARLRLLSISLLKTATKSALRYKNCMILNA